VAVKTGSPDANPPKTPPSEQYCALREVRKRYLTHTLADIIQHPQVSTASSFSTAAALALAAATFTPTPTAVSANDGGGRQPGCGV
jgi:hypothetical protein